MNTFFWILIVVAIVAPEVPNFKRYYRDWKEQRELKLRYEAFGPHKSEFKYKDRNTTRLILVNDERIEFSADFGFDFKYIQKFDVSFSDSEITYYTRPETVRDGAAGLAGMAAGYAVGGSVGALVGGFLGSMNTTTQTTVYSTYSSGYCLLEIYLTENPLKYCIHDPKTAYEVLDFANQALEEYRKRTGYNDV